MSERLDWARRAVAAEDELESARARIAALEDHLAAFVRKGNDPALLTRIKVCEDLLAEVVFRPAARRGEDWRRSWVARVEAQLRIGEIFRRDGL